MLVRGAVGLVLASTSLLIFSSHRQPSTGSVVVTATCASTPLSPSTMKRRSGA